MKCPYFAEKQIPLVPECRATIVPFEPSTIDQIDYCGTRGHRICPLYRNACGDRSLMTNQDENRILA
jgi:hypothetical protein